MFLLWEKPDSLLNLQPRRMNAQHKDGYELPITLTMGEYVEKGKRFFIASFRDERQLTSDAELNNAIDATKARIIATVETEMLQFSEHYRSSDRRRRQLEEDNKTLTLALRDVKRQLTLQKAQLEELEKANQLLRHSSGNNRVSKSPSPAKVSSKGVGKKENEEEKSQLPAVLEDAFDTSLSDTVSSVSSSGGGRSITTINYDDVFISEKISDGRGMAADVYLCTVDGWTCAMKEFQVNDKVKKLASVCLETEEVFMLKCQPVERAFYFLFNCLTVITSCSLPLLGDSCPSLTNSLVSSNFIDTRNKAISDVSEGDRNARELTASSKYLPISLPQLQWEEVAALHHQVLRNTALED